MQDKTIIAVAVGVTAMVLIAFCYMVYMVFGPRGDGLVFGSVMAAISAVAAGVIGYKINVSKSIDQTPPPEK